MTIKLNGEVYEVEDLAVMTLGPEDLVLVRVSDRFSPLQMRELRAFLLDTAFPANPVVVIPAESVAIVRQPS